MGMSMGGMQMIIHTSVADVSTIANRTYRLGVLKIVMHVASPIGRLYGGAVFAAGGYAAVFSTAISFHLLGFVYLAFMRETLSKEARQRSSVTSYGSRSIYKIPEIIVKTTFRKDGYRRSIVVTILLIHLLLCMCLQPPYYLFSRYMFDWTTSYYSYWTFYRDLLSFLALSLLLPLLVGRLKLPDVAIGMTGGGSGTIMYILTGNILNANMVWLMYLAPAVGVWEVAGFLATRSMISKAANGGEELGTLFTAQAVIDVVAQGSAGPMYAAIYNATIEFFPGASFFVCAFMYTLIVFGFRLCEVFFRKWDRLKALDRKSSCSS